MADNPWLCESDVTSNLYSSLHHYYKLYPYYYKQAPGSDIAHFSGTEVSVRVMSVCIWSPCAWPVVDWMRSVELCPLWCSVTAGMGWSSPTWQQAKWVSRSAPTVLSCSSAPVHLFTESTNKPCKREPAHKKPSAVCQKKKPKISKSCWIKKDYFCQTVNASWEILLPQIVLL